MRRLLGLIIVAAVVAGGAAILVVRSRKAGPSEPGLPYQFVERSRETGLLFRYVSGREGQRWAIESLGTGIGFIDYNNDGLLDVYFTQGHYLPKSQREQERVGDQLFRNRGDGTFEDVTAAAGCGETGYGQGVAVGDCNNDGWDDIFVANYGGNVLYRNNGDGTFTDVTAESGLNNSPYADSWPNSCGFVDYNLDGYLDLYVCNYSSYRLETHEDLMSPELGISVYRGPPTIRGQQDILYRNNGDGTFTDVTLAAGVDVYWPADLDSTASPRGRGMSLAFPDVNNDGWPDIFVGNDTDPPFLFLNNQDGTFTECADRYGVVRSTSGFFANMMGVDYGDLNGDGVVDFVCSNFQKRPQDLYISTPAGTYQDVADSMILGRISNDYLRWGTGLVDFDNDGDLDLFIACGHVFDNADALLKEPVLQKNLLFDNRFNEGGDFTNVTDIGGPGMQVVHWHRSALFGDFNNDGHIDVIVGNLPLEEKGADGRPDVLRNEWKEGVPPNNWVTFTLRGTVSNRDALGARLYLTAGDLKQMGDVKATFSYLTSNDRRVHFGLGKHEKVDRLEVHWPSGIVTTYEDLPVNQFITLTEPETPPPGTTLRKLKPHTSQ
jgi:hypothetical protein